MKYIYLFAILVMPLFGFSSNWEKGFKTEKTIIDNEKVYIASEDTIRAEEVQSKHIMAIGYQIGGFTLIGLDYEVRIHDYFGVHFGAGLYGYTAGLKIHTKPHRDSHFFNISYKDAGFGGMNGPALEFGGRLVFRKGGRFGLHYQAGIFVISDIEAEYKEALFKDKETPEALLSIGAGFSW